MLYLGHPHALRRMTPEARRDALGWYLWRLQNPAGPSAAGMSALDFAKMHAPPAG